MKWIEFAVYTTEIGVELVCGALAGVGIEQVAIEETGAQIEAHLRQMAPYWDFADVASLAGQNGPCVKAYIADIPAQEALRQKARRAVEDIEQYYAVEEIAPLRIEERQLDDEDWANSWKQYYKPMNIGKRLLVCPSWEVESLLAERRKRAGPQGVSVDEGVGLPGSGGSGHDINGIAEENLPDNGIVIDGRALITLDPGMVFGTGAHHTTRLCMEALETCVRDGDRILDLGCGSGILSIAALRLGAGSAVCVDIDPVAERVVKENIRMNGLHDSGVQVHTGNILTDKRLQQAVLGEYDIVVANIIADVVIGLCPIVRGYLKSNGLFLCSGIIDERAEEVAEAIEAAGLSLVCRLRSKEDGEETLETGWLAFLSKAEE